MDADILKLVVFVHVVAAVLWFGSAAVLELLEWETSQESERERLERTLVRGGWFSTHVFAPCAVVTALFGVIAVAIGKPTFGDEWVIIALVLVVLVTLLGALGIGRNMSRLARRMEAGASQQEIDERQARIRTLSHLDLALLFFILFDMVMRPTGYDPAFIILSGAFFGGVAAWLLLKFTEKLEHHAPLSSSH
jgi:uncharacterized membrane protein